MTIIHWAVEFALCGVLAFFIVWITAEVSEGYLAALVGATRPAGRARLATLAGANLGRLSGSVTQRAVYL